MGSWQENSPEFLRKSLTNGPEKSPARVHSVWAARISRWTSREIQPFSRSQQQQRRRHLVTQSHVVPHGLWLLNQVHRRLWIPKQICYSCDDQKYVCSHESCTYHWCSHSGFHNVMTAIIGPAVTQSNQRQLNLRLSRYLLIPHIFVHRIETFFGRNSLDPALWVNKVAEIQKASLAIVVHLRAQRLLLLTFSGCSVQPQAAPSDCNCAFNSQQQQQQLLPLTMRSLDQ